MQTTNSKFKDLLTVQVKKAGFVLKSAVKRRKWTNHIFL